MTPTAKAFIKIKLASLFSLFAKPKLNIAKPVTRNVDSSSQNTDCNSGQDQDHPHMAGVKELAKIADQAMCVRGKYAKTLPLLCILKDPVDGRQIIIANSATWPFDVPVHCRPAFGFARRLVSWGGAGA